jgi:hypothetical protein
MASAPGAGASAAPVSADPHVGVPHPPAEFVTPFRGIEDGIERAGWIFRSAKDAISNEAQRNGCSARRPRRLADALTRMLAPRRRISERTGVQILPGSCRRSCPLECARR